MISKHTKITLLLCLFSSSLFAQVGSEIETYPYVAALYKNCGNEIKIIGPTVLPLDNIHYESIGGKVMVNASDKRIITINPYSVKVLLKMYRDSTLIGSKEFKVRLIPKPTFEIYADSTALVQKGNEEQYIDKSITYITVKAKPDVTLASYVPKDARYTVKSYRVALVREHKTIDTLSFSTETGNIKNLLAQAKTGDVLFLEIVNVRRQNFLNRVEEVHLGTITRVIRIL